MDSKIVKSKQEGIEDILELTEKEEELLFNKVILYGACYGINSKKLPEEIVKEIDNKYDFLCTKNDNECPVRKSEGKYNFCDYKKTIDYIKQLEKSGKGKDIVIGKYKIKF